VSIEKPTGATGAGALHNHSRRIALSVVAGQVAVALVTALVLTVLCNGRFGYSALVGAGIGILPTYYLALRMFRRTASMSPEQALRNIYLGEGIKVVFTISLFVLAMLLLDVELSIVGATYLATVAVNWVAVYRADLGESPRRRV
jgi:F0F1-type ATP synthase assembly protein I